MEVLHMDSFIRRAGSHSFWGHDWDGRTVERGIKWGFVGDLLLRGYHLCMVILRSCSVNNVHGKRICD